MQQQISLLNAGNGGGGGSGGATVQQVLNAIRIQGYIDLGNRWRVGMLSNGGQSFYIVDKLTTSPAVNFYEYRPGQGMVTY